MLVDLATSHFASLSANVPDVKVANFYVTANPLSPTKTSYVTRPSISVKNTFPDGNSRGLFYQEGFYPDGFFAVAGTVLYKVGFDNSLTVLGTLPGTDKCKFSSTIYSICIVSDGDVYLYDGVAVTAVPTPDGVKISGTAALNNYILLTVEDSVKFYWINPGELVIDPLSFASAEYSADTLKTVSVISDEVWFHGANTTEVWAASGDANAPFQRIAGRVYNTGCIHKDAAAVCINQGSPAVAWVSDDKAVVLGQGLPSRISNEYIEDVLKQSSDFNLWFFRRHRNDFLVLTTDIKTVIFDFTSQGWYVWNSYLSDTWDAVYGIQINDLVWACGRLRNSSLYSVNTSGPNQDDADFVIAEVTGWVETSSSKPTSCNNLNLGLNPGYGASYVSPPVVELRYSDDQGVTWSTYSQADIGVRGSADTKTSFRSLGLIRQPGRRFELRFSGTDSLRLDYLTMNE